MKITVFNKENTELFVTHIMDELPCIGAHLVYMGDEYVVIKCDHQTNSVQVKSISLNLPKFNRLTQNA